MREHLKAFGYGNQDISAGLTKFWLDRSLRISADEQVEFMRRLHRGELPLAARSMDIVKEIMVLARKGSMIYRGKTGSCEGRDGQSGWFVGSVVANGRARVFATHVEGDGADGRLARSITESLLRELRLLREDDLE